MSRRLIRFLVDEEAATAVEYAVVLAFILMTAIGAITVFGQAASGTWAANTTKLDTVGFGS